MANWFVIGAAVFATGLGSAASAQQLKGLMPGEIAAVARTRALDLRIAQPLGETRPHPLVAGMIVSREVAPNATLGVGLATLYGRKKSGNDVRITGGPRGSRKPAVRFVLRF